MELPGNQAQWRQEQAKQLGRIADFAASKSDIKAMTCWINWDGKDPNWFEHGSLFFSDGTPKESFYGVQLGLAGVLLDRTYRISDDWTRNFVLVGNGNVGAQVVTHRSNPSWGVSKWRVHLGPAGLIRLEKQHFSGRFLEADDDGNVTIQSSSDSGRQLWRPMRGSAWDRLTLTNLRTGRRLNSVGTSNNAPLRVWTSNGAGNQNWLFQLEQ